VQAESGQKWLDFLNAYGTLVEDSLALAKGQERGVLEVLAGPRA
jgi:hypothetical protein